jgi:hypothetical protein
VYGLLLFLVLITIPFYYSFVSSLEAQYKLVPPI